MLRVSIGDAQTMQPQLCYTTKGDPKDGLKVPAAAVDKVPAVSRRCRTVLANLSDILECPIRAVLALRQLGGRQLVGIV